MPAATAALPYARGLHIAADPRYADGRPRICGHSTLCGSTSEGPTIPETERIQQAIAKSATAYKRLERLQRESDLIPIGDQKTGCIGEFYAYRYLAGKHPDAKVSYAGHSQKGWDIEVRKGHRVRRIQVKTVSAYSRGRGMSVIHHGWDELYVIYVGLDLKPLGFWVVKDKSIVPDARPSRA